MKEHTRIYLTGMCYDVSDFVPCEVCQKKAVDIHHIDNRGMGGSKSKDYFLNLMALCRKCHNEYGDIEALLPALRAIHVKQINARRKEISLQG